VSDRPSRRLEPSLRIPSRLRRHAGCDRSCNVRAVKDAARLAWVCPVHGEPLSLANSWACPQGCRYPIVDGVARFASEDSYTNGFGTQWHRWPKTQLDSYSGTTVTRDRLLATLGDDLFEQLAELTVLEVGCGAGRFTEVLLAEGAFVCSIDLSSAIDVNASNCPASDRHVLAQGDAINLPLAPHQFDLVLALGMVQHTPDSAATIRHLCSQVRPGGRIVIDHYSSGLVHRIRAARLYRAVMRRMDPDKALERSVRLHDRWTPRHRRAKSTLAKKALVLASPIVYFGDGWPQLDAQQKREWGVLDTYDSLTDRYKHRLSLAQVEAIFAMLPLEDTSVRMVGTVVVGTGSARES